MNDFNTLLETLSTMGIMREFSLAVETMDALKGVQRKMQFELGKDISVNRVMNVAIQHYAKLLKEGKV